MKKIPQQLVNKVRAQGIILPDDSAYKEISVGSKEAILFDSKEVNNILVHVGAGAELDLKGFEKNLVLILEKDAVVNYLGKEKNIIKSAKQIFAVLDAGAKFNLTLSTRDKVESDLKIKVVLAGVSATTNIEEAISANKNTETKRDVLINHLAVRTESSYFSRAIANYSAKVAIKVKTIIAKKASKSIAHQRVDNLILSDNAIVKGWPQLEINNDDVICTHALTAGHLNEEEMFYAKSRGISRKKALVMIAEGFLQPIEKKFFALKNETI